MHIDEVNNNAFYQFPQWLLKEVSICTHTNTAV